MADEKKRLRKILRACRDGLTPAYVAEISRIVQSRLLAEAIYGASSTVVLYASKDNEIDTGLIFRDALSAGRRVLFPKIVGAELALVRVAGSDDLRLGNFGLLEPIGTEIAAISELRDALICVPGLAFSATGQRLGRGGGYYDRIITCLPATTTTVGLSYSFQLLDSLPESSRDRRLDLIFTESATYRDLARQPIARTAEGGILS